MSGLRTALLGIATAPGVSRLWAPWARGVAPILMLHRFARPGTNDPGLPVDRLRDQLVSLRHRGFRVLPLMTALDFAEAGEPLDRAVVFTVDDGYADFHDLALPVFRELECPVTVFLVSGFLDTRARLWWDTVAAALRQLGRASEIESSVEALKQMPEADRLAGVQRLAQASGLPDGPAPPQDAPMTWDMVRAAGAQGVTFGPHTVSHPILSRVGAEQARFEIFESWSRVSAETNAAIPVFCYPNGAPGDQGARETGLVHQCGLRAAVTTVPGFLSAESLKSEAARMSLPRFAQPRHRAGLLQIVTGLERLRRKLRNSE